jgi:hypothetical protein
MSNEFRAHFSLNLKLDSAASLSIEKT